MIEKAAQLINTFERRERITEGSNPIWFGRDSKLFFFAWRVFFVNAKNCGWEVQHDILWCLIYGTGDAGLSYKLQIIARRYLHWESGEELTLFALYWCHVGEIISKLPYFNAHRGMYPFKHQECHPVRNLQTNCSSGKDDITSERIMDQGDGSEIVGK